MSRFHTDISRVSISVAPSPATSGTSLGVTDANAAYLPDTYPYWAVLVPTGTAPTRANSEIVKVTNGTSNAGTTTLTIVRAQGIPVTTAQTVTTSFDIYDANSSEATRLASKIITISRDLTAAGAPTDVAYAGVGFTPTSVVIVGVISGSAAVLSIGFGDSAKGVNTVIKTWDNNYYPTLVGGVIIASTGSGIYQAATIKSYDADGFTLTWTKSGSPTGTLTCYALCFR